MSAEKRKRKAQELYEMKMKAAEYYEKNGVPKKMEEILNDMFFDNPDDVYGHLANFFEKHAKIPTISKVYSRMVYDSKAQPVMQTEVYCTIKNFQRLISTSINACENYPPETSKPEDFEQAAQERKASIEAAIALIQKEIEPAFTNQDPTQQEEMDTILMNIYKKMQEAEEERKAKEAEEKGDDEAKSTASGPTPASSPTKNRKSAKGKGKGPAVVIVPDEPREVLLPGCQVVNAVSHAVCQTGASIAGQPLYQYLANYANGGQTPEKYNLPLPMVTILSSGKMWPGKQNCVKEFMLVPKPGMPVTEYMRHFTDIYNHCAKSISAKTGLVSKNVNELGALCPAYDRPEQGLDLLQEAITAIGFTAGEDFHIALNLQGQEIFDYEKGKYDVSAGLQKLSEDMGDYYGDLITRYPAIICIIDPLRKEEKENWMKLCERVTAAECLVAGDTAHHRPGLLKEEDITPAFRTSATVLHLENVNTVTDVIAAAKKMKENENEIILSTQVAETSESIIVDLAVAMNARFLKIGAPCRGERIAKFNRLLQIEDELLKAGTLGEWEELKFPLLRPPTPPPSVMSETGDGAAPAKTPTSGRSEKK